MELIDHNHNSERNQRQVHHSHMPSQVANRTGQSCDAKREPNREKEDRFQHVLRPHFAELFGIVLSRMNQVVGTKQKMRNKLRQLIQHSGHECGVHGEWSDSGKTCGLNAHRDRKQYEKQTNARRRFCWSRQCVENRDEADYQHGPP